MLRFPKVSNPLVGSCWRLFSPWKRLSIYWLKMQCNNNFIWVCILFDNFLGPLLLSSTMILLRRLKPEQRPHLGPFWWWCSGSIKSISGFYRTYFQPIPTRPWCNTLIDLHVAYRHQPWKYFISIYKLFK